MLPFNRRSLAQKLTPRAFEELERLAFTSPDDRARLAAIAMIFDRGYGKARAGLKVEDDGEPRRIQFVWGGIQSSQSPEPDLISGGE